MTDTQKTPRVRPNRDRHGEALRLVRFTNYSQLTPETRAIAKASRQRVAAQLPALTAALQTFGNALERAGWTATPSRR
ncbi:hypothetical protein ACIRU8_39480 [Streptomyces sp. NPDC101175]|uniref:hypothetical protein n=1 Tax=Streptomyces sp. NPDC101175 TaxID=3366123 RepID=UPI0038359720